MRHSKLALSFKNWWKEAVAVGFLLLVLYVSASGFGTKALSEVQELSGQNYTFLELSEYFSDLSYEKGAIYAFNVLREAELPPNIDIHLLAHTVGDILYEQEGAEGILLCTHEFRNACSHTIVIGTLLEKGPESFKEIVSLCKKAPGGPGAYTMCFHGLGHGVLAYNGYDLVKATSMCGLSGPAGGREEAECIGGTIMEMVSGVHDREVWEAKKGEYFKDSDPLYPCTATFIPASAKRMCYTYITPHLFGFDGGNEHNPTPSDYKRALPYCEKLLGDEKKACVEGFGKEFIVLAQDRDIRAIDLMTDAQFEKVMSWCDFAASRESVGMCIIGALRSVFWGGENNPVASVRFCNVADKKGFGKECFSDLYFGASLYMPRKIDRERVCQSVPDLYQKECVSKLLTP